MIGIVIAAGYGTRLKPYTESMPKALIELEDGVAIIDYIIKVMAENGIGEVYIVTRSEFKDLFALRIPSNKVIVVDVALGDGNLWTLYQAIEKLRALGIEDDVVISMSDHIYEANILKRLIKMSRDSDRVLLCLDRSVRGEEVVEGLKVVVDGSEVILTGKDIPPLSGIDTGLFYIPKNLFSEIKRVVDDKGRKATLSDFVNFLARRKLVGFVDVTGLRWIDIDSIEDLAKARRIYWDIVRRNLIKDSDGIVSRYVNREISTRISVALYRNGIFINPNILTVVVFIIGIFSFIAIYLNMYILGGVLALLSSIFDGVDGEVARLFNRQTEFGAILDTTLDRIVDTLIIGGAIYQSFSLGIASPKIEYIVIFSLAILGSIYVSFLSNIIRDKELVAKARNRFPWPTRDVRVAVLAFAIMFNQPFIGILYILFSSWFFIAVVVISIAKRVRGIGIAKIIKKAAPRPIIFTPIRVAVYEVIRDVLFLISLIFITAKGFEYLNTYLTVNISTIVWESILAVELALMAYFAYRVLRSLWYILNRVGEIVARSLWITPTVYGRISIKFILLLMIILIMYPINYLLLMSRVQRIIIDFVNYVFLIAVVILVIAIAIDVIRVLEHKIYSYISRFFK
uniref:Bifunctional IPC transferase and DIPP synthase n=1 Tax=Ignisphaera aggregans TaxID=334771 RepID=A0A7C5UZ89_9CREN